MDPTIRTISEKKLAGKHFTVTLTNERAAELWRSFMPERKMIMNSVSNDLYSVQEYKQGFDLSTFNENTPFEKWAAIEVKDFDSVPAGMETLTLGAGQYAVFTYKSLPAEAMKLVSYIYSNWLPNSSYVVDDRPHFAVMGEKYKNDSADSEEEFWVPVKAKGLE
jgi:AraC family transcriptional regulator